MKRVGSGRVSGTNIKPASDSPGVGARRGSDAIEDSLIGVANVAPGMAIPVDGCVAVIEATSPFSCRNGPHIIGGSGEEAVRRRVSTQRERELDPARAVPRVATGALLEFAIGSVVRDIANRPDVVRSRTRNGSKLDDSEAVDRERQRLPRRPIPTQSQAVDTVPYQPTPIHRLWPARTLRRSDPAAVAESYKTSNSCRRSA